MMRDMGEPAKRAATYQDVLAAPEGFIAEVLDGELLLQPRPAGRHAAAASVLAMDVGGAFHRGRGGPGGWLILYEPELHLALDILVPDLAGWRRERLPRVPDTPYFELRPDWVCEVLSPSTARIDRVRKTRIFAREGVPHVWLVDPKERTLEVLSLDGSSYRVTAYDGTEPVRAAPFEALELELDALWEAATPA